jgi:hypothetical protein
MFRRYHIHDDATFKHLSQALLYGEGTSLLFHILSPFQNND